MISLKKFLEQSDAVAATDPPPVKKAAPVKAVPMVESEAWLSAWRALTFAVCDSTERAIPPLGPALRKKLSELGRTFLETPNDQSLVTVNQAMCSELDEWSGQASRFYGEHQRDLKEIIAVVARTAEAVGQRDDRYSAEIGAFASRLRTVADEPDIASIRRTILESAGAMQSCVTKMADEGRETLRQLSVQTDDYKKRMEEAERISLLDPLTGVMNRRGLERDVARRMKDGKPFSMILMDLDEFKSVNDLYGHATGDELLRQFASELATRFPASDLVARMGGDEFVGVVDGFATVADARMGQVRSWVMGNYRLPNGQNKKVDVQVSASVGMAAWDGQETSEALLARADEQMYQAKRAGKLRPPAPALTGGRVPQKI